MELKALKTRGLGLKINIGSDEEKAQCVVFVKVLTENSYSCTSNTPKIYCIVKCLFVYLALVSLALEYGRITGSMKVYLYLRDMRYITFSLSFYP